MKAILNDLSWSRRAGLTLGPTGALALAFWALSWCWGEYQAITTAIGSCVTASELEETREALQEEHDLILAHETLLGLMAPHVLGGGS